MIGHTMAVAAVTSVSNERATFARAARWRRTRAIVIDTILFGFLSLIVNNVYGVTHVETFPQITIGAGTYVTAISVPLQILLGLLYFAIPEAMFGATPGKWWTHLKVVRLDGRPLEVRDVVIRNLLRIVDYQPALYVVGGLCVGLTRGSQRLGDLAGGTTVIQDANATTPGATRTSGDRARHVLAWSIAGAILFTMAFDYFGRPPRVIEGAFNQHELIGTLDSYTLGRPSWGLGTVTYPIRGRSGASTCTGSVELYWLVLGWDQHSAQLECVPS